MPRRSASLKAVGRGLDESASVITTLQHLLFIPLGFGAGGYALWAGQWLVAVVMLSVGVACLWFVAIECGWHHPRFDKVGIVAVITCICGCVLLVLGEVFTGFEWFVTSSIIITSGVRAAKKVLLRLDGSVAEDAEESRRLPEVSGSSTPEGRTAR